MEKQIRWRRIKYRQLEFWPESGAKLRYLFCTTPNAVKISGDFFPIYQKYWAEEVPEGHQGVPTSLHGAATPQAAPWGLVGSPLAHWPPSFVLWRVSSRKKNQGGALSWFRRRHEAELEQNQSRAPAGRSCRGNFPPGGGNRRHRHHQHSSHRRGLITINIFISTISSPNPSSSLVTNLRLATPIGTCKVASSVDYSL